jgi:D-alanine transaminase
VPDRVIYLNGEYLPASAARVSVMDRGFLFGDGVYEVIPVFGGRLLRIDEHLRRLQNSLDRVSMSNPKSVDEWTATLENLLLRNPGEDRGVYLQITRGAAEYRDLTPSPDLRPTVFIMVMHLKPVDPQQLEAGIDAITVDDFRWHACDIKSISLIANVMMRIQADNAGVVDAIMVRNGRATEGTASNVFVVKNGVLATPPKSRHLLPGITRDLVIELAENNNIDCEVREIDAHELESADEIWLTSSTREIAPVVRLNGNLVGDGRAGVLWKRMIMLYQQFKQELRDG